jgi:hypothetical protein
MLRVSIQPAGPARVMIWHVERIILPISATRFGLKARCQAASYRSSSIEAKIFTEKMGLEMRGSGFGRVSSSLQQLMQVQA